MLVESLRFYTLQVRAPWGSERGSIRRNADGAVLKSPDRLFEGAAFIASMILAAFMLHYVICLRWDLGLIHVVLQLFHDHQIFILIADIGVPLCGDTLHEGFIHGRMYRISYGKCYSV